MMRIVYLTVVSKECLILLLRFIWGWGERSQTVSPLFGAVAMLIHHVYNYHTHQLYNCK